MVSRNPAPCYRTEVCVCPTSAQFVYTSQRLCANARGRVRHNHKTAMGVHPDASERATEINVIADGSTRLRRKIKCW